LRASFQALFPPNVIPGFLFYLITIWSRDCEDENIILWAPSGAIGVRLTSASLVYRRSNHMTKFKTIGAVCLALSLAAASPSFAAGKHGHGFHGRGAHFHFAHRGGSVFRGAYGYYGTRGDTYGYGGHEIYDRSMNENGNSN
jgi:hypothetical protein